MNSMFFGAGQINDPNKYVPLLYAEAQATGNTTTTSSTYVLLNSMTITPLAGIYQVWFSCSTDNNGSGLLGGTPEDNFFSIFVDGVQVAHSERNVKMADQPLVVAINCQVEVDGTQAIEVRWRRSAATATCFERTLSALKLADVA